MLKLTRTGIGLLTRQYRSVLRKCWLINAGLFFALVPNVASADELPRQVVEAGQKVESIEGKFTGHALTDILGGFVENSGTIVTLIADIISNSVTEDRQYVADDSLIDVTASGHIDIIRGNIKNNTMTFVNDSSSWDNGFILNSTGYINSIDVNMSGNRVEGISANPAPMLFLYSGKTDHIKGNFSQNVIDINGTPEGSVIAVYGGAEVGDIEGNFIENVSIGTLGGNAGGAIAVYGSASSHVSSIKATFKNNYGKSLSGTYYGGAIYNIGIIDSIYDSIFTGNYAQSVSGTAQGGAIYNDNKIGIDAVNSNVYFYNNRAIQGSTSRYNDVYNTGTLNMNASANNSIIFNGTIEGSSGKININTDNLTGGTYVFNNAISGNSVTIGSSTATAPANIKLGTAQQADGSTSYGLLSNIALTNWGKNTLLDMRNDNIDTHSLTTLTLNNQMRLAIDARLNGASGSADTISVSGSKTASADSLIIDAINLDNTTYDSGGDTVTITLTSDSTLKNAYTLSDDIMSNISGNNYYTSVTYNSSTGTLVFDDKLINRSTLDSILANNYYKNDEFLVAKGSIKTIDSNDFTTFNCAKEA